MEAWRVTDFYGDDDALPTIQPRVLVPRFSAPPRVTIGADGIPDYIEAAKGSPYQYIAPEGFRLAIYHYGVRIKQVVVADRKRGFAIALHYHENSDWTITHDLYDENGQSQHRLYKAEPGDRSGRM